MKIDQIEKSYRSGVNVLLVVGYVCEVSKGKYTGVTYSSLCMILGTKRTGALAAVQRAVKNGLVEKTKTGRKVNIRLTKKGAIVLAKLSEAIRSEKHA